MAASSIQPSKTPACNLVLTSRRFYRTSVGLVGFEPTASASRTQRSTKLSHSPNCRISRRSSRCGSIVCLLCVEYVRGQTEIRLNQCVIQTEIRLNQCVRLGI